MITSERIRTMIEIKNVSKTYDGSYAVRELSLSMNEKEVFGMVGTNGAGKTTLLRMMAGVLKPDEGEILIDGESVWDNPMVKEKLFFITDDAYYFMNATPESMKSYYKTIYREFDAERFYKLLDSFHLKRDGRIASFSKGMRKQLSVITGICTNCRYLFCDETFDGLDPVMRQATKSLFAKEMEDRGLTPVLTSHNLRELEDICDHVGLLHEGGVLLSRDLSDMKLNINKVQAVFNSDADREKLEKAMDIVIKREQGRLFSYTVRCSEQDVRNIFATVDTVYYELLPLTLEEIFISETEVVGYDIKKIILA